LEILDNCVLKATKQQSVLENQIELLEREVNAINRLSENIYNILGPARPKCSKDECAPCVNTVANSLGDIRAIAIETREQLEGIAKLLGEQLGSLKLEY
jgi:hypothetical protein